MNLFDRLSELLAGSGESITHADRLIEEMEARLAEARFCAALAIAAEKRYGPALSAADVRAALRSLETRLAEARWQHQRLQAERLAGLAWCDVCQPGRDTVRSAFDKAEQRLRRLSGEHGPQF